MCCARVASISRGQEGEWAASGLGSTTVREMTHISPDLSKEEEVVKLLVSLGAYASRRQAAVRGSGKVQKRHGTADLETTIGRPGITL